MTHLHIWRSPPSTPHTAGLLRRAFLKFRVRRALCRMARLVASPTPDPQFLDNRVLGLLVVGVVVVLQQRGRSAVDTDTVTFAHDALLAIGRVALAS